MQFIPVRYRKDNKFDYMYNKYVNPNKIDFYAFSEISIESKIKYFIVLEVNGNIFEMTQEKNHLELELFESIDEAKYFMYSKLYNR